MKKIKVIWDDHEDGCSHCVVFESTDHDPLSAARKFLNELGDVAKYGYEIEVAKVVDDAEPSGHHW